MYICYPIDSTILLVSDYLEVSIETNIMEEPTTIQPITFVKCHRTSMLPIKDALEALSGKWKLPILVALSTGSKRFKELSKEVGGITDKVLSKELKDMEMNHLVKRTVYDTFPPTVEYSWTEHSYTLGGVVRALEEWGNLHRKKVIGG